MDESFNWPLPPYAHIPPESLGRPHEPARVTYIDGQVYEGSLPRFMPEHGYIEFFPEHAVANSLLPFEVVRTIELTRPLRIRSEEESALAARGGPSEPLPPLQRYRMLFNDGSELVGETLGHCLEQSGLYVFPPAEEGTFVRLFAPGCSLREHQIGAPIGELLVEERATSPETVQAGLEKQARLRKQLIGEYLAEQHLVTPDQLAEALKRQRGMPVIRLGEALMQENVITEDQLDAALSRQKENRKLPLGEILMEMGAIDQATLRRTLSKKLGVPFVDLRKFKVDVGAIKLVSDSIARRHRIVPLCLDEGAVVIATENPMDWQPLDEVRVFTGLQAVPAMASREDLEWAVNTYYGTIDAGANLHDLAYQLSEEGGAIEEVEKPIDEADSTLVRLVNKIILDAHHSGASDIHIEVYPGKAPTKIRFRRDGVLQDHLEVPAAFRAAIVSRIKIMAGLDISERRRGQDGKINFAQFGPARIELRVATIPTLGGMEDVVMRILAAAAALPIDKLGLRPIYLEQVKRIITRSHGLCLVCGPTGSGKTTTLHSFLGFVNTPDRKIWTAEDPVEITQPGLRQVQMLAKIGWTFSAAMRSFLRADPDIIMVGEMRDEETAHIGIEASLTGHFVFSTLHTNSAPESITRLLDMGLDPFNFADALQAVLAQRLARRLCTGCRASRPASDEEIDDLAMEYCEDSPLEPSRVIEEWRRTHAHDGSLLIWSAPGCDTCEGSGYRGRVGLHELLVNTPPVRRLIQSRAAVADIRDAAVREGMRTLKQDGIDKVLQGLTDMHQVRAVSS